MLKTAAAAALFAVPALALSSCAAPEQPSDTPGTTPSIWTGSPSPTTAPGAHQEGEATEKLTADLKMADGTTVATADFEFADGYATITVQTTESGKLTPGFHGMHIHSVGKCEANSVAPTGGAPGNFNSAGGHFQVPGHTGHPASGDLTSLQVREDGSALLVTTTDAFTAEDLLEGEKTAIIIHANADNFANIPPERYQQVNGNPPPDETTLATGDAGNRVACGVIGTG
ncbi:superoxide dismutase family protein [Mycolicibacterium elephantis]|uniref:Superoxide dismutase [Cu-Zn] n=1 Tax=Mycolicibacterium elephantis DSM 44368 TaxID=1335622 RepID=A0A439DW30_9MYCO|nr:superoxide dismutase family protein [Mycolicibacterium elephantis]KKW63790.1 superoxide dismutase [Mycolicibacterium elephantis]MCV7220027.1 superoxide dismutase family protein [Mycolicibacterium elephantis]OBA82922.1 superoxide dismutase [Mycolicibacterium elephantis]OBB18455.1 superoxide dismutase [Mycolicibacterium elephantis]OBE93499.1 superoxide dismutase [Mycolicibacterium elephantis]